LKEIERQVYLDDYLEDKHTEATNNILGRSERCQYCGWAVSRGLHVGAMKLYAVGSGVKVFVDANVYYRCMEGLRADMKFLYGMLNDLKVRGLDVVAVGKDYENSLYAWVVALPEWRELSLEYNGFKIVLVGFKDFGEDSLQKVDEDIIHCLSLIIL
jgi:hypothetical protein